MPAGSVAPTTTQLGWCPAHDRRTKVFSSNKLPAPPPGRRRRPPANLGSKDLPRAYNFCCACPMDLLRTADVFADVNKSMLRLQQSLCAVMSTKHNGRWLQYMQNLTIGAHICMCKWKQRYQAKVCIFAYSYVTCYMLVKSDSACIGQR